MAVDALLDRPAADELVHQNVLLLPDAIGAVGGLVLDGRIPPAVEVDDVRRRGEVQAGAAGLELRLKNGGPRSSLELFNQCAAVLYTGVSAVEHQTRAAEHRGEIMLQRTGHLSKLGEDERLFLTRRDFGSHSSPDAGICRSGRGRSRRSQALRRVVAELLETHEKGKDQAAPLNAFGGLETFL